MLLLVAALAVGALITRHTYCLTRPRLNAPPVDIAAMPWPEKLRGALTGRHASRPLPALTPEEMGLPYQETVIETRDGVQLHGWMVPIAGATTTIVLTHGFGDGLTEATLMRLTGLARAGFSVAAFTFRAHGESGGEYCTLGHDEWRDIEAVVEFVRRAYPDQARRIAGLGFSMGGAALVHALVQSVTMDAAILDSVYPSLLQSAAQRCRLAGGPAFPAAHGMLLCAGAMYGFNPFRFRPVEMVRSLSCPVLVIAGEKDDRVPVLEAQRLFDNAPEPKELWIVPGAGHQTTCAANPRAYIDRVTEFLRRHVRE